MSRKIPYEEFLKRAVAIYGDKFTYVEDSYYSISSPMAIVCEIHGEFSRSPKHFLLGTGCPDCWDETGVKRSVWRRPRLTYEAFAKEAQSIHGDSFDYPHWSGDRSRKDKVPVKCFVHGLSDRVIGYVLAGKGCMKCEYEKRAVSYAEFLRRANIAQGNAYTYVESSYSGMNFSVTAICSDHGEFSVSAGGHAIGQRRCPDCVPTDSSGERMIRSLLQEAGVDFVEQFTAPDLIGLGGLKIRIDFAIPASRVLIEFDGAQHFRPIRFGGKTQEEAAEDFERIQVHDRLKTEWAEVNDWKLFRFCSTLNLAEEIRSKVCLADSSD